MRASIQKQQTLAADRPPLIPRPRLVWCRLLNDVRRSCSKFWAGCDTEPAVESGPDIVRQAHLFETGVLSPANWERTNSPQHLSPAAMSGFPKSIQWPAQCGATRDGKHVWGISKAAQANLKPNPHRWTIDSRVADPPFPVAACPDGQRNAVESECLAAVQEATLASGLIFQGQYTAAKVVDEVWVPAGCSYSKLSRRAMFNRNPAGRSTHSYQLVCIKEGGVGPDSDEQQHVAVHVRPDEAGRGPATTAALQPEAPLSCSVCEDEAWERSVAAGAKGTIEAVDVVVSYCNHNLDWLQEYVSSLHNLGAPVRSVTIYSKCSAAAPAAKASDTWSQVFVELPNVGRCDHTYAYHMSTMYAELADATIFIKDSYDPASPQHRPGLYLPRNVEYTWEHVKTDGVPVG